ncbi:MAG: thioesterase family protein [Parvularculaceae bacterium]
MQNAIHAWPVANPYVERRVVSVGDIDGFGHVNNVRYIDWANEIAWAHSATLGLSFEDYERIGVGCVVWRHEFDYVAPALKDEAVDIATWIAESDGRVRLTRAYEFRRASDDKVLFRGRTKFVTIDMKSGKPARMPKEFIEAYQPTE